MAEDAQSFSPIRMTASSEEAAVAQALQIAGLSRDQVHVEILRQDAKGVTVRVGPRRDDALSEAASIETPVATSDATTQSGDLTEVEANTNRVDDSVDDAVMAAGAASQSFEEDIFSTSPSDAPALDAAFAHDAISDAVSSDASASAPDAPHEYLQDSATNRDESRQSPTEAAPIEIDAATQERARAMAQEFLDRMGMEAQVEIAQSGGVADGVDAGGRLHLNIEGEDVGILIGKHGQTLQAFQYLLNVSLNNQPAQGEVEEGAPTSREAALRVVVDAGGYRERRSQSLEQVARDAALRAKRDRRSVRLEPMPAYERRLVHLALQEDTTIATTSEGRDPLRHVVVSPAGMRPTPSGGFNDRSSKGGFNRNRSGFNSNKGESNRGGNSGGGFGNRASG